MIDLADLDDVLAAMMMFKPGVSDINFSVGRPPQVEADGKLEAVTFAGNPEPLGADETEAIAMALIGDQPALLRELDENGACDTAHTLGDGSRVRVNVFKARGQHSLVLRALPPSIPTLAELGLPQVLNEIAGLKNGLVVVTGSTGSGKTTTMTAVLDSVNEQRPVHVITLEDPIEFIHPHKKATMNQRELGQDFVSFADGLKAALRQAPKVIFVGEIRDRETVEVALKASETGHLVLSTLHTIDAGQTINRLVGLFEGPEQPLVRQRLAETMRFVVSQRLLPKEGGGRVAAVEIMGSSLRIKDLITRGEDAERTFYGAISEARNRGWQTFDQHIVEHYEQGRISEDVAKGSCSDASVVGRELDRIHSTRGEETSDLGSLEMAFPAHRRGK